MRLNTRLVILCAAAAWATAEPAAAAELRISGAATVARVIILPNQAAIEQETGVTLVVAANGDGNGLKGLYAGLSRSELYRRMSDGSLRRKKFGRSTYILTESLIDLVDKFAPLRRSCCSGCIPDATGIVDNLPDDGTGP
jgi:hypothetical protein